jgi:hypothetical protein
MYAKKIFRKSPLLLTALGLVTINTFPVSANSIEAKNPKLLPEENSTIVALDFLDAIQGAVQYIQVSNISDEQEIAIGKETNQ